MSDVCAYGNIACAGAKRGALARMQRARIAEGAAHDRRSRNVPAVVQIIVETPRFSSRKKV